MHHEFYFLAKKIIENKSENKLALATIVSVKGSAYRREGTRMIIEDLGQWHGNISGGCLEGDILLKAKQVIDTGISILVTYDTRESENKEIRVALGCNGIIDILIEPVNNTIFDVSKRLTELFELDKTAFLTTQIQVNNNKIKTLYQLNETRPENFPKVAIEIENYCHIEKNGDSIILSEFLGLQRKIVIWGSGPDSHAVSYFTGQLGWKTVVSSDCGLEKFKSNQDDLKLVQSNFNDFVKNTALHKNTAVLLVSHDYYKDYFVFEKIAQTELKYIGIMGPKKRGERMIKEFKKRNPEISINEEIIYYPVGLDIGSDNPAEIALSVVAEIQAVFNGKKSVSLREKSSRIHDTIHEDDFEEFNPTNTVCSINQF